MKRRIIGLVFIFLVGCESYQPKPLDMHPSFAQRLLLPPPQINTGPPIKPAMFQADAKAFSMDQLAALAVLNNGDLKVARAATGVSRAQAFSAGLLQDPQFSYLMGYPLNQTDTSLAYTYTLGYNLQSLLSYSLVKRTALAQLKQQELNVLWQEWQVVSQARILYIRAVEQHKLMAVLQENRRLANSQYLQAKHALDEGNVTIDVMESAFATLADVDQQINTLQQQINQNHHDLNVLLGLAPTVNLPLKNSIPPLNLDYAQIQNELKDLASRRPDLLALKAGYESADAKYRQAILEQFPGITLGGFRGRDNTDLISEGYTLSFNLPIFNRNRGNVAIEKATRQNLYEDFKNRLNTAYLDVQNLINSQKLLEQGCAHEKIHLQHLEKLYKNARLAFRANDIDGPTYNGFLTKLLSKRIEAITLEQTRLEQQVALQTLVGGQLPVRNKKDLGHD